MHTESKANGGLKEHIAACHRVWGMVSTDACVKKELEDRGGKQVELSHFGATTYRGPQEIADAVLALRADGLNPHSMAKGAILQFTGAFLINGGLKSFRTKAGAKVDSKLPEPVTTTKAEPSKPVKVAKEGKSKVTGPKPPVAPAPPAAPPAARAEAAEPEAKPKRELAPSESFCASIVLSHLLITAAQLGAYDTDPGHEQRNERLNALLAEYQKIAEARISNWPRLPKLANGKPA